MIRIEHLKKAYGKLDVLKDLSLTFEKPGIAAVLGPNGSGKTTLIKSILGMVIPQSGDIYFDGQPVKNNWAYREQIGYLPQIARFPDNLKVQELIRFVQSLRSKNGNPEYFIDYFELQPYLNKRLGTLSGGTRQKVNLVLALCYDSPVLILDEPTSGLDPVALVRLKDLLRKEKAAGKIILVTSHTLDFVQEMADEILFLLDGRIHFRGTLAALQQQQGETNLERAIAGILTGNKLTHNGKVQTPDFRRRISDLRD